MSNLNQVRFTKINKSYYGKTSNYPNLFILGDFLEDLGKSSRVLDFLKDPSDGPLPISEHHLGKRGNVVVIEREYEWEDLLSIEMPRDTLIKIVETFQEFANEDSPEIILSEENGIYTMTSQGKTVKIN